MTEISNQTAYRTLFELRSGEPSFRVGISAAGLVYVTECLAGNSAFMYGEIHVYRISKEEYRKYLEEARKRGKLKKAVRKGCATMEELERYAK